MNRQRAGRLGVLALPWTWLLLFLVAPACIVLAIALAEPVERIPPFSLANPTLANFRLVLTDPLDRDALLLSLRVAGLSTLACLLLGYPMALAIARAPARRRDALLLAAMLPFWTGFLMRLNAWIGLLSDKGWANAVLVWCGLGPHRLLYTDAAMYVGIVYTYLPFMVLPLYTRLSQLDPVLLEAAADLGARPSRAFLRITLPLSLPGMLAGCLLVFVPAVGEYVIPELLGGPQAQMIGRVLWSEFFANRDWPTASALACVLLGVLLLAPTGLAVVGRRLWRREQAAGAAPFPAARRSRA
jgi:putrescine transport system permease protein